MIVDNHYIPCTPVGDSSPPRSGTVSRPRAQSAALALPGPGAAISIPEDAALVLIDMQRAFERPLWSYWSAPGGTRNNPDAELVAARLLDTWRETGRPVIHVKHDSTSPVSPLRPRSPTAEFNPLVRPREGEPVYHKHGDSAFVGTTLAHDLRTRRLRTLALVGLTTDHAVSSTARSAANLGFTVFVVSDATATFDREGAEGRPYPAEVMHQTSLASLHGEFAIVATSDVILDGVAASETEANCPAHTLGMRGSKHA